VETSVTRPITVPTPDSTSVTVPGSTVPVPTSLSIPPCESSTYEDDNDDSDIEGKIFGSGAELLHTIREKVISVKETLQEKIKEKLEELTSTQHKTETLSQSVTNMLLEKQYNTAGYRLPVVMKVINHTPGVKPPHGLYYINRTGRKIYLNPSQRKKWLKGEEIAGCIQGCSNNE
jgi:hypothetical protein